MEIERGRDLAMPRFGIWLLVLTLALIVGVAVAQDDGAEPMEGAVVVAEEGDAVDVTEAEEPESAVEETAEESEEPVGAIVPAETLAPTDGPTPEPAETGAPIVLYILIGGMLTAAGLFLMRRSAVRAS